MPEQVKRDARELWIPVGSVFAIFGAIFYVATAWANQGGKIEAHEHRLNRVEAAIQNIAQTIDGVKESNIALKVSVENLSYRIGEVGKDVKDIRTAVK